MAEGKVILRNKKNHIGQDIGWDLESSSGFHLEKQMVDQAHDLAMSEKKHVELNQRNICKFAESK